MGWMDSGGSLWLMDLEKLESSSSPEPRPIVTLPQPLQAPMPSSSSSSSATPMVPEYPVARHLGGELWACSDGVGRLYVVDASSREITATHELLDSSSNSSPLLPFQLLSVLLQGDAATAVVSYTTRCTSAASGGRRVKEQSTYHVALVRFALRTDASLEAQPLQQLVTLSGTDIPSYAAFIGSRCCIGGPCVYTAGTSSQSPTHEDSQTATPSMPEPAADEIVDIPREGANAFAFDATAADPAEPVMPPPFSWTQETDSVTIVFPLPSAISAKDIKVVYTPSFVSLSISSTNLPPEPAGTRSLPLPELVRAHFWDYIDAGTSTWTWERTGGDKGKFGVLALHLEKRHEGTRWPSVFKADAEAQAGSNKSDTRYLDVEEMLDRTELLKITEAMEKFTSDIASGREDGQGGLAGMEQRSSLLGEEFDMDVDADERASGKGIVFTWLEAVDTDSPALQPDKRAETADLVTLPLPATAPASQGQVRLESVSIRNDVDALLFTPPSPGVAAWTHASTFPALTFVLASKRDVVQVYHYHDRLCIGLEAGSPAASLGSEARAPYSSMRTSKMNAYLYYPPPPGSGAKTAKQRVVGLADPAAGAVLGAIGIERSGGALDIAVLCEKEVVILRNVL